MRCDLQIFSGCVCHLEQLHAQSPFLFPTVFSIYTILTEEVHCCQKTVSYHQNRVSACLTHWKGGRELVLSKRVFKTKGEREKKV